MDVPWTCHSLRGWNHLIGSFINLSCWARKHLYLLNPIQKGMQLWSVHFCPWLARLFTQLHWWIVVLEGEETHWILYRIAGGSPFGHGLPVQGLSSPEGLNGTCRVSVESHEPPQQQSIDCQTMGFSNITYCLFVPQLYKDDDALGPCCLTSHILALDTCSWSRAHMG